MPGPMRGPGGPGPGPGGPRGGFQKPKNTKKTLSRLLSYLKNDIPLLIVVIVFILLSTGAQLFSTLKLQPIINLKRGTLHSRRTALSCEEILMALSVCAATNPVAQAALDKLSLLQGCQAHTTAILSQSDEQVYKKLGMDVTSDPEFPSENLYYM